MKLSCTQHAATRVSKLDCKGGYFKPLQGMDPRKEIIQQVLDGGKSFSKIASACIKKMRDVQLTFISYLDIPLWDVAQVKYPNYTEKERLEPFLTSSFKKDSIPPLFVAFSQLAKLLFGSVL